MKSHITSPARRTSYAAATFAALLLACTLLLGLGTPHACHATEVHDIDAHQAHALLQNPPKGLQILDVRTAAEFAEGHLANAILIDLLQDTFTAKLMQLDRETPWLLYCRSGNRSAQALTIMEQLGFREVYHLTSGFNGWKKAKLPVVK